MSRTQEEDGEKERKKEKEDGEKEKRQLGSYSDDGILGCGIVVMWNIDVEDEGVVIGKAGHNPAFKAVHGQNLAPVFAVHPDRGPSVRAGLAKLGARMLLDGPVEHCRIQLRV